MDALKDLKRLLRSHLTLGELAEKVDVSREHLSRILNGHSEVPWRDAARWADAVGLVGDVREQFIDAICLAAAPPRIQQMLVDERERRIAAEKFRDECRHRLKRARDVLDIMEQPMALPKPAGESQG